MSWGDWLGTGIIATYKRKYKPFNEAREFVRSLKLKNNGEWDKYIHSRKKPNDLPYSPSHVYKNDGFISMSDFLGTGRIANQFRKYRSFKKARKFVHSLKLKNFSEWDKYCKSGKKPNDIPCSFSNVYKNKEFISIYDWLGFTGRLNTSDLLTFEKAHNWVKKLNLKSEKEWVKYFKNNKVPKNIPKNLIYHYSKDKKWKGIGYFLGNKNITYKFLDLWNYQKTKKFVVYK